MLQLVVAVASRSQRIRERVHRALSWMDIHGRVVSCEVQTSARTKEPAAPKSIQLYNAINLYYIRRQCIMQNVDKFNHAILSTRDMYW